MSAAELERYLRENIPLASALGIRVSRADPSGVAIAVPLEPNLNHHSTAFGGSIAALCMLAGWALVHLRLLDEVPPPSLVIHASSVHYLAPIRGPFTAVSEPASAEEWAKFRRALARRGRGRIHVPVRVQSEGTVAATFDGTYVAIARG